MKKVLLLSVRSQHVYNMPTKKKTIELRKMLPKWVLEALERGEEVDVYVYCTKAEPYLCHFNNSYYDLLSDNVLRIVEKVVKINGTVPLKFTLRNVDEVYLKTHWNSTDDYDEWLVSDTLSNGELQDKSCLSNDEMENYFHEANGYALHIEDLVVFDNPMRLNDFYRDGGHIPSNNPIMKEFDDMYEDSRLIKAPQSMQIVWIKEKNNE